MPPAPALRLGLIGAGRWGRNYVRTIAGRTEVALTRIASRNPETAGLAPRGCAVTAEWREVIHAPDVDGVIVAAPPAAHAEITLEAIRAGRPVLVEKPLALSEAAAREIVAAAAARSVLVMVEHTYLFHAAYRELRRIARREAPVRAIRSAAGGGGRQRSDVPVLWDWAPHDVALCLDLLGEEPREVRAAWEDARLLLGMRFPGGARAEIRIGTVGARQRRFEVELDRATLVFDDLAPQKLVRGGAAVAVAAELPLTTAVLEFAAAIAAGSASLESAQLGAAVVRVLARCESELAR